MKKEKIDICGACGIGDYVENITNIPSADPIKPQSVPICNECLAKAKDEYLSLLNDDEVFKEQWIDDRSFNEWLLDVFLPDEITKSLDC